MSGSKAAARCGGPEVFKEGDLRQVRNGDTLEVEQSRKLAHRLVVGLAALGITQVRRHGQIALHQGVPREAANVRHLNEESMAELPPDAEVHVHGVWCLQLVVDRVCDREVIWIQRREATLGGGPQ